MSAVANFTGNNRDAGVVEANCAYLTEEPRLQLPPVTIPPRAQARTLLALETKAGLGFPDFSLIRVPGKGSLGYWSYWLGIQGPL